MSDYKIGDEVQMRDAKTKWRDCIYCGKSRQMDMTYLNTDGETFGWLNIELRRKPRTEKRMMRWAKNRAGEYYALENDNVGQFPYYTMIGEPFEHEFEVTE